MKSFIGEILGAKLRRLLAVEVIEFNRKIRKEEGQKNTDTYLLYAIIS